MLNQLKLKDSVPHESYPDPDSPEFDLDKAIAHVAHWFPTQGPIKDFIHHNTLHAVQHLSFHDGVALAGKIFGARSYLPITDYQKMYRQGRIKDFAITWALERSGCPAHQQKILEKSLFAEDNLSHYPPVSLANHGIRNAWLNQLGLDLNTLTHPILFRLLGNFLDQGISRWTLPKNGERFWDCVLRLAQNSLLPIYPLNQPHIRKLLPQGPDQIINAALEKIAGSSRFYEQYLLEMMLAHPGWSGMVSVIEDNPNALLDSRLISLKEMIALELACELAFLYLKKGENFISIDQVELPDETLLMSHGLPKPTVPLVLKIWQEAMEWSLHSELLAALKPLPPKATVTPPPEAQALFCIDDREGSLRRYLEEQNPAIETYGAAGFFGIDFLYQGLDDAYPVAQCPVIITPKHLIKESSKLDEPDKSPKPGEIKHLHIKSHTLLRGWLYTQTLGLAYSVKMAWDVFRPASKLPKIKSLSEISAHSQLHLLRENDTPTEKGYLLGFSYQEMAEKIGGLLTNIGLTKNFAPLVVIVAHGSSSVNNPHFAAYDCGACSGKPGAPNARAFAWMANSPEVRKLLLQQGIDIPEKTFFVAALHNTSRDEITYYDIDGEQHDAIHGLSRFQDAMKSALQSNSLERCRWFELAPGSQSVKKAHAHVTARATSIFEPRPEYNHANNLYCIVGRRHLTSDLFLDRRAFLHSYDPDTDSSGNILGKIMSAIIPVCGGINLEYYFSRIDNSVYGAGTKLPHNVIGLLGVANGVEGDLRTGLPQQMIETHEPARLLIVVEQSPEIAAKAVANLGDLKEWLDNEWVRLVSRDPNNGNLSLYQQDRWKPVELPFGRTDTPFATFSNTINFAPSRTIPVHRLVRKI